MITSLIINCITKLNVYLYVLKKTPQIIYQFYTYIFISRLNNIIGFGQIAYVGIIFIS